MSISKRILIAIVSLFMAMLFAVPNVLIIVMAIVLLYGSQFISAIFCLMFAWHIAKLVEHFYKKSQEK